MSTGDPMCPAHGYLIPCSICIAESFGWVSSRPMSQAAINTLASYDNESCPSCDSLSTRLSSAEQDRDRLAAECESLAKDNAILVAQRDEWRQRADDVALSRRQEEMSAIHEADAQRSENQRVMMLLGSMMTMRELVVKWHDARCIRYPGCDGSSHDFQCPTEQAETALYEYAKTLTKDSPQ